MCKYLIPLAFLLPLMLVTGCNRQLPDINTGLGQAFELKAGQTASITGEDLKIKFLELVSDSRCPINAICIWEGEATCRTEITLAGNTYSKTLVKPGSGPEYVATNFGDYEIQFDVQPYPEAGKQITKGDYFLKLIVNKRPQLSSGILVTFDVVGESYKVFIKSPATIEKVFALQRGESRANIPSGKLLRGADYNRPWSWHIDPDDIDMAEVTIELCDGTPSQVEANLDYWMDTVGRFCPWSARIVNVEDLR